MLYRIWSFITGKTLLEAVYRKLEEVERAIEAVEEFGRAIDTLDEWDDAHPVLRTAHLSYRRSLILEAIYAYQKVREYDLGSDDFLDELCELLDETPPPEDPPPKPGPDASGLLLH